MKDSLRLKLSAIRERTQFSSQKFSATSLSTFLILYTKANRECYIDYMHGARALYSWLKPIDLYSHLSIDRLNSLESIRVPRLLYSYDIQELTKILSDNNTSNFCDRNKISNAIILTTLDLFKKGEI